MSEILEEQSAPQAGDTEALQGFDGLDLMEGLDCDELMNDKDLSASVDADNYTNIDEPHWLFDTSILGDVLKPFSTIIRDKQEIVAKTIHLIPVDGGVLFRANTGEHNIEVFAETLNLTKQLKSEFIIEFNTLMTVMRNSGQRLLITERNGSPMVSIYGGEMEFEAYNLDKELYKHPAFSMSSEEMDKFDTPSFMMFLEKGARSMALASRPEDRKIRVENGKGYASYLSSVVEFSDIELSSLSLRFDYITCLIRFLSRNTEFYYKELERNYVFRSGRSTVVFPKIETEDLTSVGSIIGQFKVKYTFAVSPNLFHSILSTMKALIGATGVVRLETVNSHLRVKASTRTGKNLDFPLASASPDADLKISIPVSSLISTALMLKKDPVVEIQVSDSDSICFSMGGMKIVFGSLAH